MVNAVVEFLMSGGFWFSAFLALLIAFLVESTSIGYGRGWEGGGRIYLATRRAQLEVVGLFLVSLITLIVAMGGLRAAIGF